jgi:RNA polymerase sigma-70 factor (ECF subfamily)
MPGSPSSFFHDGHQDVLGRPTLMFNTPPSLLERLRQTSERDAWEKFVDMYTPLFVVWTKRLNLAEPEAADLIQDVFTILVQELPRFQYNAQKSFRAWLKTILLNRWRNQLRRRRGDKEQGEEGLENVAATDEFQEFEETEYRRYLARRALELMQKEFQPATWKACWEFVVQDRPAAEVSAELGLTINAVYLAKARVLRRLREELAGLLD